jgi:hypothetical protein
MMLPVTASGDPSQHAIVGIGLKLASALCMSSMAA